MAIDDSTRAVLRETVQRLTAHRQRLSDEIKGIDRIISDARILIGREPAPALDEAANTVLNLSAPTPSPVSEWETAERARKARSSRRYNMRLRDERRQLLAATPFAKAIYTILSEWGALTASELGALLRERSLAELPEGSGNPALARYVGQRVRSLVAFVDRDESTDPVRYFLKPGAMPPGTEEQQPTTDQPQPQNDQPSEEPADASIRSE